MGGLVRDASGLAGWPGREGCFSDETDRGTLARIAFPQPLFSPIQLIATTSALVLHALGTSKLNPCTLQTHQGQQKSKNIYHRDTKNTKEHQEIFVFSQKPLDLELTPGDTLSLEVKP
jgi:hypothetical protein